MVALRFESFGEISEVLRTTTIESPKPRTGEALVRVAAAAINPSYVKNVLGQMRGTSLPEPQGAISRAWSSRRRAQNCQSAAKYGAVAETWGLSATTLMPSL